MPVSSVSIGCCTDYTVAGKCTVGGKDKTREEADMTFSPFLSPKVSNAPMLIFIIIIIIIIIVVIIIVHCRLFLGTPCRYIDYVTAVLYHKHLLLFYVLKLTRMRFCP